MVVIGCSAQDVLSWPDNQGRDRGEVAALDPVGKRKLRQRCGGITRGGADVVGEPKSRVATVRALNGVAAGVSAQPLFLAQMFASGAVALGLVMAAATMPPDRFTTFSLLTLITFISTGAVRAFLFMPALMETRNNRDAHIHVRVAVGGALCAMVCFAIGAAVSGVHDPAWLGLLSLASTLPIIAEWLRMRGMALDERWNVARSDALRLAATLFGAPVLWWTTRPEVFFLYLSLTYLANVIYLGSRLPRVSAHLSPTAFWRQASSLLADFMIGQLMSAIPLIVLAGLGTSQYIGGIRIAQTLLGPITLVMSSAWTNLLADGATRESHSNPADLIRHGRRAAVNLSLFSMVVVPLVLAALFVTNFSFRGASNHSLIVGTLLVGMLLITAGFSGVDAMVLRLLGHHTVATLGRAFLVVVAGAGYVLGYSFGGVDSSLIFGFVCAAVANPLAFVLPTLFIFPRYR